MNRAEEAYGKWHKRDGPGFGAMDDKGSFMAGYAAGRAEMVKLMRELTAWIDPRTIPKDIKDRVNALFDKYDANG